MLMDGRHFRLERGRPARRRLQGPGREPFRHRGHGGRSARRRRGRRPAASRGRRRGTRALRRHARAGRAVWRRPGRRRHQRLGRAAGDQRHRCSAKRPRAARSAARAPRPGDAILVTGPLGGSLFAGRHLRPEPRIAEALALHQAAPIHAMIDISDGLSSDLGHILAESGGLGAVLDAAAIPIHADAVAMSRQRRNAGARPRAQRRRRLRAVPGRSRPKTPPGCSPPPRAGHALPRRYRDRGSRSAAARPRRPGETDRAHGLRSFPHGQRSRHGRENEPATR